VGFTRQDVLELRALSMTGSIASVLYFALSRPAFAPMAWSSLFAATNAFKIAQIIDERKGNVVLSEHEEDIYEEHFLSHGVTPKQYAKLLQKAEVIDAKKGDKIVSAGERIDKVYLVVAGQTRASFLGRRVTVSGDTLVFEHDPCMNNVYFYLSHFTISLFYVPPFLRTGCIIGTR
jgi:CRP-like cAMP-binding protein